MLPGRLKIQLWVATLITPVVVWPLVWLAGKIDVDRFAWPQDGYVLAGVYGWGVILTGLGLLLIALPSTFAGEKLSQGRRWGVMATNSCVAVLLCAGINALGIAEPLLSAMLTHVVFATTIFTALYATRDDFVGETADA